MKRFSRLFDQVCRFENLLEASRLARAGKRYRTDVLRFEFDAEGRLMELSAALRAGDWQPSPHRHFLIHEPKLRCISAAPYPDRVVQHALCRVIGPRSERRLIFDCWANRLGKGSHRAVLRYQAFAGRFRYALSIDLRRYFPSVDHELLKQSFRRDFRDARLLALMDRIVDQGNVPDPHRVYFPGDDLFTPFERPKGLPIGNLTSQLWANTYLGPLDHWIKQRLGAPAYLRYVDDLVLLHDDIGLLRSWLARVREQLFGLRLALHERKCVIRRTDEGVPFLGYVVWPERIRVRGETVRRFRRRVRRRLRGESEGAGARTGASLAAWNGHVALAGTYRRRTAGSG